MLSQDITTQIQINIISNIIGVFIVIVYVSWILVNYVATPSVDVTHAEGASTTIHGVNSAGNSSDKDKNKSILRKVVEYTAYTVLVGTTIYAVYWFSTGGPERLRSTLAELANSVSGSGK